MKFKKMLVLGFAVAIGFLVEVQMKPHTNFGSLSPISTKTTALPQVDFSLGTNAEANKCMLYCAGPSIVCSYCGGPTSNCAYTGSVTCVD